MIERPLIATQADNDTGPPGSITPAERVFSLTGGAALLLHGWRSGGPSGILQVVAGAYAFYRGTTGQCALKRALTPTPFEQQFSLEHDWPNSEAITRSVTISRPLDEVHDFLNAVENLGPLLRWVTRVEQVAPDTTHWTVRAPAGRELNFTLIQSPAQDPGTLHWKTPDDTRWQHDVTLTLSPAPAGRGTQVKAVVVCKPTLGALGYGVARAIGLFSDKALLNGLQAVKQKLETGEVSTNRLQPDNDDDFFYVHGDGSVKTGVVIERGVV